MAVCLICPECAYSTTNLEETTCKWCRAGLLRKCTVCGSAITEGKTIYCKSCGAKLRISYVPIQ